MSIIELLENKGYKKYRCINKKGKFIYEESFMDSFSSMINGGLVIHFIKNEDYKNPIIFGLHEKNKPPTLITPRPYIRLKRFCNNLKRIETITEVFDDAMNICLLKENSEDIFEALFNKNKQFNYDLTSYE